MKVLGTCILLGAPTGNLRMALPLGTHAHPTCYISVSTQNSCLHCPNSGRSLLPAQRHPLCCPPSRKRWDT